MAIRFPSPSRWVWLSPWVIIGTVCILAGILLIVAVRNLNRQKEFVVEALLSEANVLTRSLEASNRAGMMGMMGQGWGRRQLQALLEETAQQNEVLYVSVLSSGGRVMAHSDPDRVDKFEKAAFPKPDEITYRFTDTGQRAFEVTRAYQPWLREMGRGRGRGGQCAAFSPSDKERNLFITVGLDPAPFEAALEQERRNTILLFSLMFLAGLAGFLSLVWSQHYSIARRDLKDVEAFTATVVNRMPMGLVATDKAGRIERVNAAAGAILPATSGADANFQDIPCFAPVVRMLETRETLTGHELQCRTSPGQSVPLLVNAAVIRDGEGNVAGRVYLFSDMSEIKQLEEQLRRSERLAALGRLAAGVAHEIRNPLSSIKGFATILAGRFNEDDNGRKIAQVMEQEVERLNRVVTELLDFARPTELNKRPASCRDLIEHSLKLVERDAVNQNVSVQWEAQPADLQVQIDPDRFSQVLLNLYLNALQAMDGGGNLNVKAQLKEDEVLLTVADTGAGIPTEDLPHIFDPYFTTKPRGVGLGLANVHKLVEAHGGDIEVESAPGQGTVFTVHIPIPA